MPYSEIYVMHIVLLMHHTIFTLFSEKSGSDPHLWCIGITRYPILWLIPQTIVWGIYLSLYLPVCSYWYHMLVLLLFEHWCILRTVELWLIILGCKLQLTLVLLDQVIFSSMTFFCHKVTCTFVYLSHENNWITDMHVYL